MTLSYKQKILGILLFSSTFTLQAKVERSLLVAMSVPLIGGIYALSIEDNEGFKQLLYSSAFTAHLTTLLKHTVKRQRPNHENDLSFPSGHASAAFTGASFLHHRYGLGWGAPMYVIGTVIGFQRVNKKDHYWSDVIAGAALGYVSGMLFSAPYPDVWMVPTIERRSYGMQFGMRFG